VARPKRDRFRPTCEREVIEFLVGRSPLSAVADPHGTDWIYWIPPDDSDVWMRRLQRDERALFDPACVDEPDGEDPAVYPDLGSPKRIARQDDARADPVRGATLTTKVENARPHAAETDAQVRRTRAARRMTIVELNRFRRGLLFLSDATHSWSVAIIEQGIDRSSNSISATPWYSSLLPRRIVFARKRESIGGRRARAGELPRLRGTHADAATELIEWARAYELTSKKLSAYDCPAENMMAAIAAIAPAGLKLSPGLNDIFFAPDACERKWAFRLNNYRLRTPARRT
jgi:hypothetical protein